MKIYTKKGDTGTTQLIGGTRVPKNNIRIESYGTVDELISFLGLVRDYMRDDHSKTILKTIQDRLFTINSSLASDPVKSKMKIPVINEGDVTLLENEIDKMNEQLPELTSFLLPGGHPANSICHIARTVCRRAERQVVNLSEHDTVDPLIIKYLNRLSDYLFVLSRKISKDFGAEEIQWKPQL
jgi:cob(I)alamin adenosyltransferase